MSRGTCAVCGAPAERDFLCGGCKFDEAFITVAPVKALFGKWGLRCGHEECRERYREMGARECQGMVVEGEAGVV